MSESSNLATRGAWQSVSRPGSALLAALALLWTLTATAVWVTDRSGWSGADVIRVPFMQGHEISVVVWTRETRYIDKEYNHSASVTYRPGLTVGFWHQDLHASTAKRLLVVALPVWPLLVGAGLLTGAAAWLRLRPGRPVS